MVLDIVDPTSEGLCMIAVGIDGDLICATLSLRDGLSHLFCGLEPVEDSRIFLLYLHCGLILELFSQDLVFVRILGQGSLLFQGF